MNKIKIVLFMSFLSLILINNSNQSTAATLQHNPHHKVTIDAIQKCLGIAKRAIEVGPAKQPLISCNIPFSFNEAELNAVLNQTTSNKSDAKPDETTSSEKTTTTKTVKTLINVKSAKCLAKVRVESALLQQAIDMKEGTLTLPRQNVSCNLQTNSDKAKRATFSFEPAGIFQQSCLKNFSPQMGNFKLDCTFCRLNILAKTMSYWVNYIGSRMAPGINKALGKSCQG